MAIEVVKQDTKKMRAEEKEQHEMSSKVKVYKMIDGKKTLVRTEPSVPKGFRQSKEKFWASSDGK